MGSSKPEKKEKKDKKDKKRSEVDGVSKPKKDKKEKKEKKEKLKSAVNSTLDDQLQADVAASVTVVKDDDGKSVKVLAPVVGALVPFAVPLADEKATKKIMKTVRKGMFAPALTPASYNIGASLGIYGARSVSIVYDHNNKNANTIPLQQRRNTRPSSAA